MESNYDLKMKRMGFLPCRMGYLTDWMVKVAEDELNETEETRSLAISEFRSLIADYPEVYPPEPEIESIKTAQEGTNGGGAYPYRDKNGSLIVFYNIGRWDPDEFSLPVVFSAMTFLLLQCIEDPATQVCGVQVIFDAKNISLKHIRTLSPRYLQLISKALRNTLPIRFKQVHVVNESVIFSYIFNIFKFFLTEKIKKRIHFHGSDMKHLHKYIPKEVLPAEYDGDNTDYCASEWVKKEAYSYLEKYKAMHRCGFR
nr:alpha-tocopherol transfer protein-like [Parasteatoda tepidariorum]